MCSARRVVLAVAMAMACDAGGDAEEGADEGERPSPYADDGDDPEAEPPGLGPDEVRASAMAGLQAFVALQPDEVTDAFETMMVLEDGCPEEQLAVSEGEGSVITWYTEGCVTSTGLALRGGGRFERFGFVDGDRVVEGVTLSSEGGAMRMDTSDGRWLELSGYVYHERGSSPDGNDSYFEINGRLAADQTTAAGSALLDGRSFAQGGLYSYAGGGYQVLGGQGSLGGELVSPAQAFQFSELLLVPQACGVEPGGTISVRDDVGYWHDVVFDASTFEGDEEPVFEPDLCDGCGTYVVAGELLGDLCVERSDMEALLAWEEFPW
ncbi:hypothetical protein [Paraliomyxa miuraensis]|uniref:hypothetical protein n=1 Tax=Paraliomyxa miuraensis TaxID=376150 RepID=UPI00224FC450|nr:hypothetical protein [Paraliomyxa miuraensis]MCX4245974.1 hypothetical protein [Paraliomyxa miuraensis]